MKYHRPIDGPISHPWDEPRPLSNPGLHVHGAVDFGRGNIRTGTDIESPEAGWPFAFALFRAEGRTDSWSEQLKSGWSFPWGSYRHDVFGAVLGLKGESGRVHLFAHCYFNQVYTQSLFPRQAWTYQEEKADSRWPMFLWHTFAHKGRQVERGEVIGAVGSAGLSDGPHGHWEIHDGWVRTPHAERIDPEEHIE